MPNPVLAESASASNSLPNLPAGKMAPESLEEGSFDFPEPPVEVQGDAGAGKANTEPVEAPEAEASEAGDDTPPESKKGDEGGADDDIPAPEPTLSDAFREGPEEAAKREEAEAKAKEKAKPAEEAKSEEKKEGDAAQPSDAEKKAADAAQSERDADLKVEQNPHNHPKTRKVISSFKDKVVEARNQRDAIAKEKADLEAKLKEAEARATQAKLPEAVETELNTLRERVRELDISRDPQIEAKYDKRITANEATIIDTLKAQGFGQVLDADGKVVRENPKAFDALKQAGMSFKALKPYIDKLEEAGLVDEAEGIREAIRENVRISRDKAAEINTWKTGYEQRKQQQTAQQQAEQTARVEAIRNATVKESEAEAAALGKQFGFLNEPPAPTASDAPAVAKAKQAAIDEFRAATGKVQEILKSLNPGQNVTPEQETALLAKRNAMALKSALFEQMVVPRLTRDLKIRDSRIVELESELAKLRNVGKISRLQSAPAESQSRGNEPKTLEEALGSGPQ